MPLFIPPDPSSHFTQVYDAFTQLGTTEGMSTARGAEDAPVAWGFDLATSLPELRWLALGVAATSPTVVVVPLAQEASLPEIVLARDLARVHGPSLAAGEVVDVSSIREVARMSPTLPALWRPEPPPPALRELGLADVVVVRPARRRSCAVQQLYRRLERSVGRWRDLVALDAPAALLAGEEDQIRAAYEKLVAAGWDIEDDPLPEAVAAAVAVLGSGGQG